MGDPRKTRKQFKRPLKIWDSANIEREKTLKETYGLKNKREIWRTEAILRKKRKSARSLLALPLEERLKREKELLQSLARLGILDEKASLDDVLTLAVESFLERRLQTLAWRKGLANTPKQARQFITHGHVAIGARRVTAPGRIVTLEEEKTLGYYAGKKMVIRPPEKEEKAKGKEKPKTIRQKFEEAKPAEPGKGKEGLAGKAGEDKPGEKARGKAEEKETGKGKEEEGKGKPGKKETGKGKEEGKGKPAEPKKGGKKAGAPEKVKEGKAEKAKHSAKSKEGKPSREKKEEQAKGASK